MAEYAGINLRLSRDEFERLTSAAQRELRHPRDQARMLLRQALGLTPDANHTNANRGAKVSQAQRAAIASR